MLVVGQTRMLVEDALDHLLLGVSDLNYGIEWFERRAGVQAVMGGSHPGRGTRNALVSVGGARYLEIIGPDPGQVVGDHQFQLSSLAEPRLINFAIATTDIDNTAASLRKTGLHATDAREGARRTASGLLLRWKTLGVESRFQSGVVNPIPFFIEWAVDSTHPSRTASPGCTLECLRFEHPRADELEAALRAIGLDAKVERADEVRIIASVRAPNGSVELT